MTTQQLYLTWYPMYLYNDTHLIDDITHYVCMKLHLLHAWHLGILYDIISTLADNTPLFVCHGTHSVYDIIFIYDVTHPLCMTTQALYLPWNPLNMPSHPLYMSSHPLCWRHHTYCVSHHRSHMYAITPSLSKTSHLQCKASQVAYVCHYMH